MKEQSKADEDTELQAYNDYAKSMQKEYENIASALNCSIDCAADIYYLRTRSRHTPELEAELIRLYSIGTPPNIYELANEISSVPKPKKM